MKRDRSLIFSAAGGLASSLLAASVSAQTPVPPSGPSPPVVQEYVRPVKRAFRHAFYTLQDNLIGYPQEFVEPPLGAHVRTTMAVMHAKADPHRFTMYQTDFLPGSTDLSPVGAGRLNLMVTRLASWRGPILIEWSPDQPGLAESRREALLTLLQGGGLTVIPEMVVIGPSPFPGLYGTYANAMITTLYIRDQGAPAAYSLTPTIPGGGLSSSGGGSN